MAPGVLLAVLIVLVVAIPAVAFVFGPENAVRVLVVALVVLAGLRVFTTGGGLLVARTRTLDIVLLLLAAAVLAALAPSASTVDVGG